MNRYAFLYSSFLMGLWVKSEENRGDIVDMKVGKV